MGRRGVTRRRVDGEKLEQFIEHHGFETHAEFARYCGISLRSLQSMLSSGSAPVTTCYAVAAVFGRTFDDIFGPDDSEEIVLWKVCLGV